MSVVLVNYCKGYFLNTITIYIIDEKSIIVSKYINIESTLGSLYYHAIKSPFIYTYKILICRRVQSILLGISQTRNYYSTLSYVTWCFKAVNIKRAATFEPSIKPRLARDGALFKLPHESREKIIIHSPVYRKQRHK